MFLLSRVRGVPGQNALYRPRMCCCPSASVTTPGIGKTTDVDVVRLLDASCVTIARIDGGRERLGAREVSVGARTGIREHRHQREERCQNDIQLGHPVPVRLTSVSIRDPKRLHQRTRRLQRHSIAVVACCPLSDLGAVRLSPVSGENEGESRGPPGGTTPSILRPVWRWSNSAHLVRTEVHAIDPQCVPPWGPPRLPQAAAQKGHDVDAVLLRSLVESHSMMTSRSFPKMRGGSTILDRS